jgi:hypothetical protein
MRYLVRGEFIEESLEGRTPEESDLYFQQVVRPSLEALADEKAVRGVTAGERASVFLLDADSSVEVESLLSSLPFRESVRWTVSPIQSLKAALDQHRKAVRAMRALIAGR